MRAKTLTVGVGVIAAVCTVALAPTSAYADYAPSSSDVVGVGSDTVQNAADFVADGDFLGHNGYNFGKKNKFISIDATADANARLAYGTGGAVGLAGSDLSVPNYKCSPGTGSTAGTGNQSGTHDESKVCVLNPTVVLRQGTSPIQRPNGSGAGFKLLQSDTDTTSGKTKNGLVDFSRASSARKGGSNFDSVQIGNDPVGMLTKSTSNAHALSKSQLAAIYNCTITNWNQVGGTAGTILPLLPQPGSGTRDFFLGDIGVTTPGPCVVNVEENDPEAIDASASPANAVEPMSVSRLYLFQGKKSDGTPNGGTRGSFPYFKDPSCSGDSSCAGTSLAPDVKLWGGPNATDPKPTDNADTYYTVRPLYIYFRHADITSTKAFQPGSSANWITTMLYDQSGATTPYFCSGAGQVLIASAGIDPACNYTLGGP